MYHHTRTRLKDGSEGNGQEKNNITFTFPNNQLPQEKLFLLQGRPKHNIIQQFLYRTPGPRYGPCNSRLPRLPICFCVSSKNCWRNTEIAASDKEGNESGYSWQELTQTYTSNSSNLWLFCCPFYVLYIVPYIYLVKLFPTQNYSVDTLQKEMVKHWYKSEVSHVAREVTF